MRVALSRPFPFPRASHILSDSVVHSVTVLSSTCTLYPNLSVNSSSMLANASDIDDDPLDSPLCANKALNKGSGSDLPRFCALRKIPRVALLLK